jgi:hypothetical protein
MTQVPQEQEIETMLLLDTTESMKWSASETDQTPRKDVVGEAIGTIVEVLAAADSQAAREAEEQEDEEAGGLRTILFSGNRPGRDIEDLNPSNLQEKWNEIHWGGDTWIVPGFNTLLQVYKDEFGSRPPEQRPILRALIITDGEAKDADQFDALLERVSGNMYVIIATVGHGQDHERAIASYQAIAQRNKHLQVVNLSGADPETISKTLLSMISD